jgi:hypothetical protein
VTGKERHAEAETHAATQAMIPNVKEGLSRMRGRVFRLSLRSSVMTPSFASRKANAVERNLFIFQGLNKD